MKCKPIVLKEFEENHLNDMLSVFKLVFQSFLGLQNWIRCIPLIKHLFSLANFFLKIITLIVKECLT